MKQIWEDLVTTLRCLCPVVWYGNCLEDTRIVRVVSDKRQGQHFGSLKDLYVQNDDKELLAAKGHSTAVRDTSTSQTTATVAL